MDFYYGRGRGHGGGGGGWNDVKIGKNHITINQQKQSNDTDIDFKNVIVLPFNKNEYPINREFHIKHEAPCSCCFKTDGKIWMKKGLGQKSRNKCKGMKRVCSKQLKYYYD